MDRHFAVLHSACLLQDLVDVGSCVHTLLQHRGYQILQASRKLRVAWEFVARIEDSQLPLILERGCVVAKLVKQYAKCPNVAFFVHWLLPIDIHHLGTPVLQCRMFLNVLVHQSALDHCGRRRLRRSSRAEVAQLESLRRSPGGDQDVLDFNVSMQQRRL